MGAIIPVERKQQILPFIKKNFGKLSQREIARKLRIGKTTVNRWCAELCLFHTWHTVNEKFFDIWSEDSAYTLGYIFADGNVAWDPRPSKSYRSLTITASAKDKGHLKYIRSMLFSTKPLLYSPPTNSYRLIAVSKRLCQRLMRLGVIPRKSLIVKFPKIPRKYVRHFIRGVVDGDGTVRYVARKRNPYFEIQICSGSPKFLRKLVNVIKQNIYIKTNISKVQTNTYLARYTCKRAMLLADWIYSGSNLFLNRKYAHYKTALLRAAGGDVSA